MIYQLVLIMRLALESVVRNHARIRCIVTIRTSSRVRSSKFVYSAAANSFVSSRSFMIDARLSTIDLPPWKKSVKAGIENSAAKREAVHFRHVGHHAITQQCNPTSRTFYLHIMLGAIVTREINPLDIGDWQSCHHSILKGRTPGNHTKSQRSA